MPSGHRKTWTFNPRTYAINEAECREIAERAAWDMAGWSHAMTLFQRYLDAVKRHNSDLPKMHFRGCSCRRCRWVEKNRVWLTLEHPDGGRQLLMECYDDWRDIQAGRLGVEEMKIPENFDLSFITYEQYRMPVDYGLDKR